MSMDSLSPFGKGGFNGYIFASNNPVMYQDPSGHTAKSSAMSGGSMGIGIFLLCLIPFSFFSVIGLGMVVSSATGMASQATAGNEGASKALGIISGVVGIGTGVAATVVGIAGAVLGIGALAAAAAAGTASALSVAGAVGGAVSAAFSTGSVLAGTGSFVAGLTGKNGASIAQILSYTSMGLGAAALATGLASLAAGVASGFAGLSEVVGDGDFTPLPNASPSNASPSNAPPLNSDIPYINVSGEIRPNTGNTEL